MCSFICCCVPLLGMPSHQSMAQGWKDLLKVRSTYYKLYGANVRDTYTIVSLGFFPDCFEECSSFLRHKMTMISPSILKQYSIPFNKVSAFAPSLVEGLIIV